MMLHQRPAKQLAGQKQKYCSRTLLHVIRKSFKSIGKSCPIAGRNPPIRQAGLLSRQMRAFVLPIEGHQ